ncbi:hypothetical protein [Confluentibacter sediminis]|uniref:hypothetical protein n=1 Tax=Confluentibacter sediminis TaxID=2219045 RepID=UPI0013A6DDA5|nr:hypothetical protein [Confluentibacter sediminis]
MEANTETVEKPKKKSLKKFHADWKAIQKQITDFGFEHQDVIWGIETRFSNSEKGDLEWIWTYKGTDSSK